MPGSYAHITLVNEASERRRLRRIPGFPREALDAAGLHLDFLELGCIGPDYPYLDIFSGDSKRWADAMHYTHTCQAISVAAELIRGLPEGVTKAQCLAWLMGYTAHVVSDMSIHPVVELKVGPYSGNEPQHRRCEMHQDAYIFGRIGTSMPQVADHLRATVLRCGTSDDPSRLDPDLKGLWVRVLETVHPAASTDDPPDIDKWHRRCRTILGKILPTSSRFVGFARHACDGLGLSYPTAGRIARKEYIESLQVPGGKRMCYDDVFDRAIEQVQQAWLTVTQYVVGEAKVLAFRNDEWDLDTGRNISDEQAGLVFWPVA